MANAKLPRGVHAVRKAVKAGVRWHFYAWRGGPKFWTDKLHYPTSVEFLAAFTAAIALPKPKLYMTSQMADDFLSSPERPKGARTYEDCRKWGLRFADAFKDDPAALFEEPASRAEVNEWRKQWAHSPRQYDYAGTVVTRILNWAWKDAGKIKQHHCTGFAKVYEVDRAEIVWAAAHREAVDAKSAGMGAPNPDGRVRDRATPRRPDPPDMGACRKHAYGAQAAR